MVLDFDEINVCTCLICYLEKICHLCFVYFCLIVCLISVIRTDTERASIYNIQSGKKLLKHTLYTVDAFTVSQCTNLCTLDRACRSVNFHEHAPGSSKPCVINGDTHTNYARDLTLDVEFVYASIEGY